MKIICIGRNYSEHARELNNVVEGNPVVFLKPESSLLNGRQPFFIPDFSKEIHHEIELVVRINRLGKHIEEKFANKYYSEIGIGIDFTARDIQSELKSKGLPWELAKAFDGSAAVGEFVSLLDLPPVHAISFSLNKNGTLVQTGSSGDMIFSVDRIISFVSQFFTLKIGDLIFTGTPAGVGPVIKGDLLEGYIGEHKLLTVKVR